jgi:hypothetical protein
MRYNRNLRCRNLKYFSLLSATIQLETRNNYWLAAIDATASKNAVETAFMIETFSSLYLKYGEHSSIEDGGGSGVRNV